MPRLDRILSCLKKLLIYMLKSRAQGKFHEKNVFCLYINHYIGSIFDQNAFLFQKKIVGKTSSTIPDKTDLTIPSVWSKIAILSTHSMVFDIKFVKIH